MSGDIYLFEALFKGHIIGDNPSELDENLITIKKVTIIYVFSP